MCDSEKELLNGGVNLKKELLFKFLVVGDFGVGKTSIIKRYAEDTFCSTYKITIGADFAIKTIEYDDATRINLQLWDIAGHERFGSLTSVYYRYAVAAAIVFDLTRPQTYNSVEKWIKDLRDRISLPNGQTLPVILLANKGDVVLNSVPNDLNQFCEQNNILTWLITSAKENINLDSAMNILLKATLMNKDTPTPHHTRDSQAIVLAKPEKIRKKYCFL